ncbi:hypothetical protein AWC38_SpisGene11087 [Stylophora pistillata]|uniref:Uncharacterized protein n=1 Tax=Stylophora pistillata TaxID=50429 RepID=A0A2B4S0U3_STYPI|nr:hypothetical protein AWC38_SpisGene11087 [Stylophora pistillata]
MTVSIFEFEFLRTCHLKGALRRLLPGSVPTNWKSLRESSGNHEKTSSTSSNGITHADELAASFPAKETIDYQDWREIPDDTHSDSSEDEEEEEEKEKEKEEGNSCALGSVNPQFQVQAPLFLENGECTYLAQQTAQGVQEIVEGFNALKFADQYRAQDSNDTE